MAYIEYMRLITAHSELVRLTERLTDPLLMQPSNANPLFQGEWLQFYANGTLIRGDGSGQHFLLLDETGRSDAQAIGSVSVGFGNFIVDTVIFTSAAAPALHARLEVATVTNAAVTGCANKSGLQTHAAGAKLGVGRVLKTAANNNGYLRVFRTAA